MKGRALSASLFPISSYSTVLTGTRQYSPFVFTLSQSLVLVTSIPNVGSFFLSFIGVAAQEAESKSLVSPTSTLFSPSAFIKLELDESNFADSQSRLSDPTLGLSPTSMACPATLAASSKQAMPGLCARVPRRSASYERPAPSANIRCKLACSRLGDSSTSTSTPATSSGRRLTLSVLLRQGKRR